MGHTVSIETYEKSNLYLETYFSCIRASLGGCTNPTTVQFTSAYKKLFLGACNKTKYGNCILQDDTKLLVFSSNPEMAATNICDSFHLSDSEKTDVYLSAIEKSSEFTNNALTYTSGFIHRKLLKKETCLSCHEFLAKTTIRSTCQLIEFVNRGHLVHPSPAINLIVKVANSCFEDIKRKGNILQHKNIVQKIECNVMSILSSRHPKLLSFLDSHVDKACFLNSVSHRVLMIKKTVLCFLSIRLKHFCKQKNELEYDKRFKRKSSKLIHFKSQ